MSPRHPGSRKITSIIFFHLWVVVAKSLKINRSREPKWALFSFTFFFFLTNIFKAHTKCKATVCFWTHFILSHWSLPVFLIYDSNFISPQAKRTTHYVQKSKVSHLAFWYVRILVSWSMRYCFSYLYETLCW